MNIFDSKKEQPGDYYPEPITKKDKPKRPLFKWVALTAGAFFGVAHIGVLGHLINASRPEYPVINFPSGDYSSYEVEANSCLLYTSPSPRDQRGSRMPSSA